MLDIWNLFFLSLRGFRCWKLSHWKEGSISNQDGPLITYVSSRLIIIICNNEQETYLILYDQNLFNMLLKVSWSLIFQLALVFKFIHASFFENYNYLRLWDYILLPYKSLLFIPSIYIYTVCPQKDWQFLKLYNKCTWTAVKITAGHYMKLGVYYSSFF